MATRTEERTPIQAYAKLQGENFVYYIQTLSVTLGRRVAGSEGVDVDLGSAKTISRTHARIEYDFDSRKFMMVPVGKNGVTINGKLHTPGDTIPLDTRCVFNMFLLLVLRIEQDGHSNWRRLLLLSAAHWPSQQ